MSVRGDLDTARRIRIFTKEVKTSVNWVCPICQREISGFSFCPECRTKAPPSVQRDYWELANQYRVSKIFKRRMCNVY